MANEFDNLDLPAFTDCEIRSLRVLDDEINRINNHYNNLIEQSKKERDRNVPYLQIWNILIWKLS